MARDFAWWTLRTLCICFAIMGVVAASALASGNYRLQHVIYFNHRYYPEAVQEQPVSPPNTISVQLDPVEVGK